MPEQDATLPPEFTPEQTTEMIGSMNDFMERFSQIAEDAGIDLGAARDSILQKVRMGDMANEIGREMVLLRRVTVQGLAAIPINGDTNDREVVQIVEYLDGIEAGEQTAVGGTDILASGEGGLVPARLGFDHRQPRIDAVGFQTTELLAGRRIIMPVEGTIKRVLDHPTGPIVEVEAAERHHVEAGSTGAPFTFLAALEGCYPYDRIVSLTPQADVLMTDEDSDSFVTNLADRVKDAARVHGMEDGAPSAGDV